MIKREGVCPPLPPPPCPIDLPLYMQQLLPLSRPLPLGYPLLSINFPNEGFYKHLKYMYM